MPIGIGLKIEVRFDYFSIINELSVRSGFLLRSQADGSFAVSVKDKVHAPSWPFMFLLEHKILVASMLATCASGNRMRIVF